MPLIMGILFLTAIIILDIGLTEWENTPKKEASKNLNVPISLSERYVFTQKTVNGACPSSYTSFNLTNCFKLG